MLCSAVTLALGVLTGWHCRLISCGETSIEWHINKEDARKFKKQGLVRTVFNPFINIQCKLCLFHLQVTINLQTANYKPYMRR